MRINAIPTSPAAGALAALAATVLLASAATAAGTGTEAGWREPLAEPKATLVTGGDSLARRDAARLASPVIADDLRQLAETLRSTDAEGRRNAALRFAAAKGRPVARLRGEDRSVVEVAIWAKKVDDGLLQDLEALGAEVTASSPARGLLNAWLPLDSLERAAALDGIREIRRPSYSIPTAGSINSEGDSAQGTALVRLIENMSGDGVKIGVLSTGLFNTSTFPPPTKANKDSRVGTGDLPAFGAQIVSFTAPDTFNFRTPQGFEIFPGTVVRIEKNSNPSTNRSYSVNSVLVNPGNGLTTVRVSPTPPVTSGGDGFLIAPGGPSSRWLGGTEIFPANFSFHVISENAPLGGPTTESGSQQSECFTNAAPFPEGAAILEVLYDVAPGATLFYGDGRTDVSLEASRRFLLQRNVDIIVDNLIFPDAGRFDGSSTLSRASEAIAKGQPFNDGISVVTKPAKIYVASAGAYSDPAKGIVTRFPLYVNDYFDPSLGQTGARVHNFALRGSQTDQALEVVADPVTGLFEAVLVWDDVWDEENPAAKIDLDLLLVNTDNYSLDSPLASSEGIQNGRGLPIERLLYTPPLGGIFGNGGALVIRKKDANDNSPVLFTLLVLQGQVLEPQYLTHGVPLVNADAPPPVITVGYLNAAVGGDSLPLCQLPGRSPGPGLADRRGFVKWFEGQRSPAVLGYGNVTTRSSGGFFNGFEGPSAAVPHIAGFLAVMKQRFPDLSPLEYYGILRDTSTSTEDGATRLPNAVKVEVPGLDQYSRAPEYLRPEPINIYLNYQLGLVNLPRVATFLVTKGPGALESWTMGGNPALPAADFRVTPQGLAITANGTRGAYGYWESDLIAVTHDTAEEPSTALRSDLAYEIVARVGSDETNPIRVPDFRLRATSGTGEESAMIVVAGLTESASNAPTTIGGKEYRLYYRPSNPAVASQGMRFAFELLGFDPNDNADATLFLQSVEIRPVKISR
jgi:hypothetical protein